MPSPDPLHNGKAKLGGYHLGLRLTLPGKKGRRRKGGELEREPMAPDKPKTLSGGAAAALEFDE